MVQETATGPEAPRQGGRESRPRDPEALRTRELLLARVELKRVGWVGLGTRAAEEVNPRGRQS